MRHTLTVTSNKVVHNRYFLTKVVIAIKRIIVRMFSILTGEVK